MLSSLSISLDLKYILGRLKIRLKTFNDNCLLKEIQSNSMLVNSE